MIRNLHFALFLFFGVLSLPGTWIFGNQTSAPGVALLMLPSSLGLAFLAATVRTMFKTRPRRFIVDFVVYAAALYALLAVGGVFTLCSYRWQI
jgi:hypothetical protein